MPECWGRHYCWFYDNSILLGTKIVIICEDALISFYDNSILLGTKIHTWLKKGGVGFYDNSILLGTKITPLSCPVH